MDQQDPQATEKVDAVEEEGDEEPARNSALGTLFWHELCGVWRNAERIKGQSASYDKS